MPHHTRTGSWPRRLLVGSILSVSACALPWAQTPARPVATIPWSGSGTWLRADFHAHTKFSDGARTVDEVVREGIAHGCDVVTVTDHADGGLRGATPEYLDAIRAAREAQPSTVVLTALEWNVPPGKGQEHATVLFPSAMATLEVMAPFKERFDDENKEGENPQLALEGLAALTPKASGQRASEQGAGAQRAGEQVAPAVFFNHPTRRPKSTSLPALTFAALKRAAPGVLVGFEGAPGHQRSVPLGSYPEGVTLVDRWDPVAATVGGAWDMWLKDGLDVWGAIANADFHEATGDFWPCELASTWVYAPERSVDGVIRALHAGSFFAEHGHIVSRAQLEVRFVGQPHVFEPGETVAARAGTKASVTLRLTVPDTDYLGRPNRIDTVELIGVTAEKADTLFSGAPAGQASAPSSTSASNEPASAPPAFTLEVTVPPGGITLRARGRRAQDDGSGLMFYTNPIRITAPR